MKILALDSSGLVASVALLENNNIIGEFSTNYHKTHSTTLLPMLDGLMQMLDLDIKNAGIDAIAIAKGPGSFTGLRIGAATAKGLALALTVPLIPISTIAALAYNGWGSSDVICPLMDARRNQVYTGAYQFETGSVLPKTRIKDCAVDISDIIGRLNAMEKPVMFLGDGVPVFAETIQETCQVPFRFAPAFMNRQRASVVGTLAMAMYREKAAVCIKGDDFAPEYLRLSQAERERLEKEGKSEDREISIAGQGNK